MTSGEDGWLGEFLAQQKLENADIPAIHRTRKDRQAAAAAQRRRSWACVSSNGEPPAFLTECQESPSTSPVDSNSHLPWAGIMDLHSPQKVPLVPYTPSQASIESPMDTWEEEERRLRRRSNGRRDVRRFSCDSFDYDDLEAARMRIRHAAWAVVDAQQKIDVDKLAPSAQAGRGSAAEPPLQVQFLSRLDSKAGHAAGKKAGPGHASKASDVQQWGATGQSKVAPSNSPPQFGGTEVAGGGRCIGGASGSARREHQSQQQQGQGQGLHKGKSSTTKAFFKKLFSASSFGLWPSSHSAKKAAAAPGGPSMFENADRKLRSFSSKA